MRFAPRAYRLAGFCALLLAACAALYWFRAPILTGAANLWVVSNALEKADAIVVLGGGRDYRPAHAATLYREGWAPRILIMDVAPGPTVEMGLMPTELSVTEKILIRKGVPKDAIVPVGRRVSSTYEESLAIRDWAFTNQAHKLIIVTEMFHTRRCRWLFNKIFAQTPAPAATRSTPAATRSTPSATRSTPSATRSTPSATRSTPTASHPAPAALRSTPTASRPAPTATRFLLFSPAPWEYTATNWWREETGLLSFQNEIVKLAYYRLRY